MEEKEEDDKEMEFQLIEDVQINIYENKEDENKKEKEEFYIFLVMTLCEIYLNINFGLFED